MQKKHIRAALLPLLSLFEYLIRRFPFFVCFVGVKTSQRPNLDSNSKSKHTCNRSPYLRSCAAYSHFAPSCTTFLTGLTLKASLCFAFIKGGVALSHDSSVVPFRSFPRPHCKHLRSLSTARKSVVNPALSSGNNVSPRSLV